jgi:hypothetical protein
MARQVGAARTEAHKFMGMFFHRDFSPADFSFCLRLTSRFCRLRGKAAGLIFPHDDAAVL